MTGQPWVNQSNTRGRGMQFKFEIVDASSFAPAAAKDVPTQGGAQYEVQDEATREYDGQHVQEQAPSSPCSSSSDAPVVSTNRSSSSSSSSSASSDSTSPSGDDGLDRVGMQEEAGIERSEVAEPDALPDVVGASSSGVHGGGGFAESTFVWREFKFTRTYKDKRRTDWTGYEVTCYHHDPHCECLWHGVWPQVLA